MDAYFKGVRRWFNFKQEYLYVYNDLGGSLPLKLNVLKSIFQYNKLFVNPILVQNVMRVLLQTYTVTN